MKKKIWIMLCGVFLLLFSVCLSIIIKRQFLHQEENEETYSDKWGEEDSGENAILGKWKVTEYAVTDNGILVPSYNITEHFLGRSIVIEEDKIIKSIYYWPKEVDYITIPYQCIEKSVEDGSAYGIRKEYRDFWYQEFGDQMLEVYTFWNTEGGTKDGYEYIITEEGKALCKYLGLVLCQDLVQLKMSDSAC